MSSLKPLRGWLQNPTNWVAVWLIATILSSLLKYLLSTDANPQEGQYTHYNNFVIFRQAYYHLLSGADLYSLYPAEHWDYYKYSPAFALLFAPFALLPTGVGLALWNLLNTAVLLRGLQRIGLPSAIALAASLAFLLPELLVSIQNSQSNALIAGLLLLALADLQADRPGRFSLWVSLTVAIKLFGVVALVFGLLYAKRLRLTGWVILCLLALALLPSLLLGWEGLLTQYRSWGALLAADHDASIGFSVQGWLTTWFGYGGPKTYVLAVGAVLFLLPLVRQRYWRHPTYQRLILASVLLWVVIFNHKAESPTFVIATTGVVLWFWQAPPTRWRWGMLALVFVFTEMSSSDLFPPYVREQILKPYVGKAVPCILVWCIVQWELLTRHFENLDPHKTHGMGKLEADVGFSPGKPAGN